MLEPPKYTYEVQLEPNHYRTIVDSMVALTLLSMRVGGVMEINNTPRHLNALDTAKNYLANILHLKTQRTFLAQDLHSIRVTAIASQGCFEVYVLERRVTASGEKDTPILLRLLGLGGSLEERHRYQPEDLAKYRQLGM